LYPHFRLQGEPVSIPFVIRETRRKFLHILSEVTVWERFESQELKQQTSKIRAFAIYTSVLGSSFPKWAEWPELIVAFD